MDKQDNSGAYERRKAPLIGSWFTTPKSYDKMSFLLSRLFKSITNDALGY